MATLTQKIDTLQSQLDAIRTELEGIGRHLGAHAELTALMLRQTEPESALVQHRVRRTVRRRGAGVAVRHLKSVLVRSGFKLTTALDD